MAAATSVSAAVAAAAVAATANVVSAAVKRADAFDAVTAVGGDDDRGDGHRRRNC